MRRVDWGRVMPAGLPCRRCRRVLWFYGGILINGDGSTKCTPRVRYWFRRHARAGVAE